MFIIIIYMVFVCLNLVLSFIKVFEIVIKGIVFSIMVMEEIFVILLYEYVVCKI